MRIGDAAARLGIDAHVLRHWEDVGLLVPNRLPSGHREYDEDLLDQARLIRIGQGVGWSLREMRDFTKADHEDRLVAIKQRRETIRARMALLAATDEFLGHVADCTHPVISECPECSAFVAACG